MRKSSIIMFLVSSLLLAPMLATTVSAQQLRLRAPAIQNALRNLEIRQFIQGLRLTQAQRENIRSILQGHRKDILESRKLLLEARLALVKDDPAGPDKFGAAQARIMALRKEILNQIKTSLTQEQLTILQKREQRQAARIEELLARMAMNQAND